MASGCTVPGQFQANGSFAFTLKFCVITSIGVSMQAQDMMINEQLSIMFASFNVRSLTNTVTISGTSAIEAAQQGEAFANQIIAALNGLSLAASEGAAVASGEALAGEIIALFGPNLTEEEAAAAVTAGEALAAEIVATLTPVLGAPGLTPADIEAINAALLAAGGLDALGPP